MRQLKDKKGYPVSVSSIQGMAGIIEGSPYMLRRWRHLKAKKDMEENKGVLYWGLKELEKEIETLGRNTDKWPAQEHWQANIGASLYLGSDGDTYQRESQRLKIVWFQEGGDPMEALKNIVSQIYFLSQCIKEITEEYD